MLQKNGTALTSGAKDLADGSAQIAKGSSELSTGASALAGGVKTLASNNKKLNDGAATLASGTEKLAKGSESLTSGMDKLLEGTETLKEGMSEYKEEGISKIVDLYDEDILGLKDRFEAVRKAGRDYQTYTQLSDGEKGSALYNGVAGDPLTAKINSCHGIDFDSKGKMYISDATFHAIRLLTPDKNGDYSKGKLETILGGVKGYTDGSGLKVKFNEPAGVLVYDDETLYVCDVQNCLI